MVKFKTWKDAYEFMRDYGNFTCLQCSGSHHNLDLAEEHSDLEYARFFCSRTASMVRLDFQFVCPEWKDIDTGEVVGDIDPLCSIWNISDDVIDVLEDENNGKWSIEEIREVINEHKELEKDEG